VDYRLSSTVAGILFSRKSLKIHDKLVPWVRVSAGREPSPSQAAVDSQSVETATMISIDVGYDAGKKNTWAQATSKCGSAPSC